MLQRAGCTVEPCPRTTETRRAPQHRVDGYYLVRRCRQTARSAKVTIGKSKNGLLLRESSGSKDAVEDARETIHHCDAPLSSAPRTYLAAAFSLVATPQLAAKVVATGWPLPGGLGQAVLDAQAMGLPLTASPTGGPQRPNRRSSGERYRDRSNGSASLACCSAG